MGNTPRLGIPKLLGNNTADFGAINTALEKIDEVAALDSQTVDQTLANPANTGLLASILSWIVGMIKAITGAADWKTVPTWTLAKIKAVLDGTDATKIPAAALAADVARLQLGCNNGFEIADRPFPATANNAYTFTRWQNILAGTDTLTPTQDNVHIKGNSKQAAKLVFVLGTGAGASRYRQRLVVADGYEHLLGLPVSVRVPAWTATNNSLRAFITTDGTGGTTTYSGYHTGDSTWQNLDVANVAVPADATYVEYGLALGASGTVWIDNVMPVQGVACCDYAKSHPADEIARCQRYYEVQGGIADGSVAYYGNAPGVNVQGFGKSFAVRKAVIPTMTKGGTWNVTNCGQPQTTGPSVDGYFLSAGALAAGNMVFSPNSADDTITAEANPS
jgi:hypothetical protein